MNDTKLTITLPVYQCESYIRGAMDSIMNQTDKNFKLIVVHDGSTDKTHDIIKEYKNKLDFILIHNDKKLGQDKAFNLSHKLVNTEYIGFFMGDDELYPNYVEEVNKYIEATHADFIRGFWMKGNIVRNPELDNDAAPCRIYKKKVWEEIGGYHPTMDFYNDNDFWEKIKHHDPPYIIGTIRNPIYRYYMRPGNISSNVPLKKSKGADDKKEFYNLWRIWESKYIEKSDYQESYHDFYSYGVKWISDITNLIKSDNIALIHNSDSIKSLVQDTFKIPCVQYGFCELPNVSQYDVVICDGFSLVKGKLNGQKGILNDAISISKKHFIMVVPVLATEFNWRQVPGYKEVESVYQSDLNLIFQQLYKHKFEFIVETNLRYKDQKEFPTSSNGLRLFRIYAKRE